MESELYTKAGYTIWKKSNATRKLKYVNIARLRRIYLKTIANQDLPKTTQVNYAEASRQFMQEGNALLYALI